MFENYIRDKITKLRLKKGVSEYKMSLDLGHSKGYIQSISSGRALPSLTEFLFILDYFDITPNQFFDDETENPILVNEVTNEIKNLSDNDLILILEIIKRFKSSH